jgi:dolichol-phosphate mannosyltransferase
LSASEIIRERDDGLDPKMKIIGITCAYRDTRNVVKVLEKFPKRAVDEMFIVVDCADGNDLEKIEKTAAKTEIPLRIMSNKERKGVGSAIREGINYACQKEYDIAVLFAGNNKDDPREIPRLLRPILTEGYDYVQGSRFLPGGRRIKNPVLRGMFSRLYPFLWGFITKARCTDVTNGFRAYRLSIFNNEHINVRQDWLNGYALEYYIHYKVLTLGYKFKEVPVSKTYPHRHKGGYSKISPFRDWWQIIGPLVYLKLGLRK